MGPFRGGCNDESVPGVFEPGMGGGETVPTGTVPPSTAAYDALRTGLSETTILGSSPWIAGVRGVGTR
jgi:hypothetical protein